MKTQFIIQSGDKFSELIADAGEMRWNGSKQERQLKLNIHSSEFVLIHVFAFAIFFYLLDNRLSRKQKRQKRSPLLKQKAKIELKYNLKTTQQHWAESWESRAERRKICWQSTANWVPIKIDKLKRSMMHRKNTMWFVSAEDQKELRTKSPFCILHISASKKESRREMRKLEIAHKTQHKTPQKQLFRC